MFMYPCWIPNGPYANQFPLSSKRCPVGTLGFKTRIGPPYPHARPKKRLHVIWGGFSELAPRRYLDGHVKEHYEMSMVLGARP